MAALKGKLDCLDHLIAKGANLEAADKACAAPQAAPIPHAPLHSAHAARRSCCTALAAAAVTACGAAAAPPYRTATPPSWVRL